MLSFVRPTAHREFAAEASKLLADVRAAVNLRAGVPNSKDFEGRDLWSGSWKRDGRHKKALVGVGVQRAKCVWCERIRDVARELDVEHYRPKARVTRWDGDPPPVGDRPPKEVDLGAGYWWLAFSWENYSLSCKVCNQEWKRNLFPVRDPRVVCTEGSETAEQPLLLDPSKPFTIGDHFRWTVDAFVEGVSEEGRATIVTCGLNRSTLVAERVKLASVLYKVLRDLRAGIARHDVAAAHRGFGELASLGSRDSAFTSMVRWFAGRDLGHEWSEFDALPE